MIKSNKRTVSIGQFRIVKRLKFILGLEAERNRTKEMNYWSPRLNPAALDPSMNFDNWWDCMLHDPVLSITFIMIVLFIKSAVLKMSINQVWIQSKGHSHSQSYIFYMLDPVSIALDKGLRLVPLFTCGSYLSMRQAEEKSLDGTYTRMLQMVKNISWKDKVKNSEL